MNAETESSSDSEGPHTPDDHDEENDVPPDFDKSDEERFKYVPTEEDTPDGRDPRTKVLSVLELEDLFISVAPDLSCTQIFYFILSCYSIEIS